MNTAAPDQTLYYLKRGEHETGPFTIGQLRSMWQSGTATADARYRFDPAAKWQPLLHLGRLLEPAPASPSASQPSHQALVLPILSLVLAFIPLGCVVGVVCAHISLRRARVTHDSTARIISIVALVVSYLAISYTALVLVGSTSALFKPSEPVFTR